MTTTVQGQQGSGAQRSQGMIAVRRVLRLVASLVKLVTTVFAAILVIHIILTVGGANPANSITVFFGDWAQRLSLGFANLFVPANENLRIVENFGLAAIAWLVIGIIVIKLLRAISP